MVKDRLAASLAKPVALASGVVLGAVSALHATGVSWVARSLESAPPDLQRLLPGVWLFFSWHLLALAGAIVATAVASPPWARPVIWGCAVVAIVDTVWVSVIAGFFIGSSLLVVAALSITFSAAVWPRSVGTP